MKILVSPFRFHVVPDEKIASLATTPSQPIEIKTYKGKQFPSFVEPEKLLKVHSSILPADDDFHISSFKGGSEYIEKEYLFTHTREKAEEFALRKKRSYFYNYCRPIIDSYLFFLFRANPMRTGNKATEPFVLRFLADPSKTIETFNRLMASLAFEALTYGRAWVKMDAPINPPKSKQDEMDRGNMPYAYLYPSPMVLDWKDSSEGAFSWVKVLFSKEINNDFLSSNDEEIVKIYFDDAIISYSKLGNLLDMTDNNLGFVPFIKLSLNGENKSFISDIAIINRSIYNWCSLLDEILYKQTFSQLVVPGDKGTKLSERRVGTASVFTFDPKSSHAPQYISPDAGQGSLMQKQIDVAIMEIFRTANLEWIDSKRATNKSGSAKSFDFENTNKILSGMATELEAAEKRIFFIFDKIRGAESPGEGYGISYPRDYSVVALDNELKQIFLTLSTNISAKLNIVLKKRVAEIMTPRLDDKEKKIIDKEIEDNEGKEESEADLAKQMDATVAAEEDEQGKFSKVKVEDKGGEDV